MKLQHGTDNEENGIATLVGRTMSTIFPSQVRYDEGSYAIYTNDGRPMLLDSLNCSLMKPCTYEPDFCHPAAVMGLKVKCPYPEEYKTPVQYELPFYYATQVLAKMAVLGVKKLLFVS